MYLLEPLVRQRIAELRQDAEAHRVASLAKTPATADAFDRALTPARRGLATRPPARSLVDLPW